MKLDATDLRYITSEEFRVLTAVEMGSKNHEVVPTALIVQISGLRNGGVNRILGSLAKRNLVARVQNSKYDGYRLTYGGYDYLAMRALSKRDSMYSVGNQIGVGKESDIYVVADAEGNEMVLKLHRLGRISFRAIKQKRDYMGKRKSASWMYMSRLAAQKEWAFMKVLHDHAFPVPKPIDQARHCILMEFIDAYPLRQIADIPSPGALYSTLMDIIVRFAKAGLIHGDYNEFNILIRRETGEPVVIDFPQMVSTSHANAEMYFNRDVDCIRTFFRRRFSYESNLYPKFRRVAKEDDGEVRGFRLDVIVAASGFKQNEQRVLEEYMERSEGLDTEDPGEPSQGEVWDGDNSGDDGEGDGGDSGTVTEEQSGTGSQNGSDHEQGPNAASQGQERPITIEERNLIPQNPPVRVNVRRQRSLGDDDVLSPISRSRPVSRSPPASRHTSRSPSPSSLLEHTASLSLTHATGIKDRVVSQVSRDRARQQKKHHSKNSARAAGRQKGSKAKMDTRIKPDRDGVWE